MHFKVPSEDKIKSARDSNKDASAVPTYLTETGMEIGDRGPANALNAILLISGGMLTAIKSKTELMVVT